jgi:hypothetical protein
MGPAHQQFFIVGEKIAVAIIQRRPGVRTPVRIVCGLLD